MKLFSVNLHLIKSISVLFLLCQLAMLNVKAQTAEEQRQYMVATLTKIAHPVLYNLSKSQLKKQMPVEHKSEIKARTSHLEAFGRTLAGMAPWLALGADDTKEGKLRKQYIDLALLSIKNATDKNNVDYLDFDKGAQPLVDAAFFAEALLRAPKQLWELLDVKTKQNVIAALKSTRNVMPYYNNWLLFSAMVEAALLKFDNSGDFMRMDYAIKQHLLWYKGDGVYGDGPEFHFDYYNSFVIHPMLLEVLQTLVDVGNNEKQELYQMELKRAQRYASIQEMLISPEATYPAIGRSMAYRFGSFHLLSKIALMQSLPEPIKPKQVRFALYNVVKRQAEAPSTFDDKGWLKIGFYGYQPQMGESYISTGSLYLCSQAFLILGLPLTDELWQAGNEDWSSRQLWKGQDVTFDKAYTEN